MPNTYNHKIEENLMKSVRAVVAIIKATKHIQRSTIESEGTSGKKLGA